MSYAYQYDTPADEPLYRRVVAEIGDEPADGLIVHLVVKHDHGLRHIGVWNSRQDWERYRTQRVEPALATVMAAAGFDQLPPRPQEEELAVIGVDIGA
jgi:hypothetical protein